MPLGMIHLGAIGDLILAMPVAEAVAHGRAIHLMGRGPHRELAEAWRPCAHYEDIETRGLRGSIPTAPAARPLLFSARPMAETRWINTRDGDGRTHISLQMLRRVRPEAYDEDLPLPSLSVPPDASAPTGRKPALIHPGSGGVMKCWPPRHFGRVAWHLAEAGFSVHWILGPAEAERFLDEQLHGEVGHVHCDLPMSLVLTMLASCAVYLGNDSGITHAAAALGRPTVALFGPTNPAVWAPRGKHVTVVDFETSATDVAAAAVRLSVET